MTASGSMDCSIVIATYDRPGGLAETLASCLNQTSKIAAECNSILRDLLRGRCACTRVWGVCDTSSCRKGCVLPPPPAGAATVQPSENVACILCYHFQTTSAAFFSDAAPPPDPSSLPPVPHPAWCLPQVAPAPRLAAPGQPGDDGAVHAGPHRPAAQDGEPAGHPGRAA